MLPDYYEVSSWALEGWNRVHQQVPRADRCEQPDLLQLSDPPRDRATVNIQVGKVTVQLAKRNRTADANVQLLEDEEVSDAEQLE